MKTIPFLQSTCLALILTVSIEAALPEAIGITPVLDTDGDVHLDRPLWFGENPALDSVYVVCEQYSGKVWLIEKEGDGWKKTEFYTAPVMANRHEEEGLLGFAFHPGFKENRQYFIYYTVRSQTLETALEERHASDDYRKDSGGDGTILMRFDQFKSKISEGSPHNGAPVEFGPDGYLYLGLGDGGNKDYTLPGTDYGQNTRSHLGAILRIDVDNREDGKSYAVPPDNPWTHDPDILPEFFAYGFRNPWRMSFDALTGDLWVADVGNVVKEEVDIVRKGENHGWRIMEGSTCFNRDAPNSPLSDCNKDGLTMPVLDLPRAKSHSITGGYVFRAAKESPWYGAYIYADYGTKLMFAMRQEDRTMTEQREYRLPDPYCYVTSFGVDQKGNLYMTAWPNTAYTREAKRGIIYKLELGEPDPLPEDTIDTVTAVQPFPIAGFAGLEVRKQGSYLLLKNPLPGRYRIEIRGLRGELLASAENSGTGPARRSPAERDEVGSRDLTLPCPGQKLFLLIWRWNGLTFSKRINLGL